MKAVIRQYPLGGDTAIRVMAAAIRLQGMWSRRLGVALACPAADKNRIGR
jgi:hypothetical protein